MPRTLLLLTSATFLPAKYDYFCIQSAAHLYLYCLAFNILLLYTSVLGDVFTFDRNAHPISQRRLIADCTQAISIYWT
ncbi:hypothetical protein BGZ60DRAFT_143881 [Tricladium varicosporioides]|nr:hypothetical protein BGZ60DRAFT_143881 [Hymenoscyphus varicosporioides]